MPRGAWTIARRATDDDAAASEIITRSFREFVRSGHGDDDVALLRCVLGHVRGRPVRDDLCDAFELVQAGGARIDDVARSFGCSVQELSHGLLGVARERRQSALAAG